ncbi:MAG: flagellar hook-associated protein FlgK [Paracoccaceae bacterium]
MSISGAFNNAMSGLVAAGRASQVVSDNLANALTPGYGVRSLELTSRLIGASGGVEVVGVTRNSDPQLMADRRLATAENSFHSATTQYMERFESVLGTPDQVGSLSAQLADFENAIISAASRPDAVERMGSVLQFASALASGLTDASNTLQAMRGNADQTINSQVGTLNGALKELETINTRIVAQRLQGHDTSSMLDQRQSLVDEISEIVPVQIMERPNFGIALYSTGGTVLLDGRAAELEFEPTTMITPYMSLSGGQLSGITVNGVSIDVSSDKGMLRGGSLAAQFSIRDDLAPDGQTQLDAIARDLMERFEDPSVDPTLGATDPGIFTDGGLSFDPLAETGLSERLTINALVDPAQGGEIWRLRDGLGATSPGDPGNATLFQNYTDALSARRTPASGSFGSGFFSAVELTAGLQSQIGSDHLLADRKLTFSSIQMIEFQQLELEQGVDTDSELQKLLLIEQAYAANARVIRAADEMMQQLLGI